MPRRRYIDLENYDFRPVPGRGELAFLGEGPQDFDEEAILNREAEAVDYEFAASDDPFVVEADEDDAWGSTILTLDDIEDLQHRRDISKRKAESGAKSVPGARAVEDAQAKVAEKQITTAKQAIEAALPRRLSFTPGQRLINRRAQILAARAAPMEGWPPKFIKKVAQAIVPKPLRDLGARIAKPFEKAGEAIKEGIEKVGDAVKSALDPKNIPGTTENLEHNTRKNIDKALGPVWAAMVNGDDQNPSVFLLLQRMNDYVTRVNEGKMPSFQIAPPGQQAVAALSGFRGFGGLGGLGGFGGFGWVTAVVSALQLGKGLMDSQYADRAQKEINKLDLDGIQVKIQEAAQAFIAAGGLPPQPGEKPEDAFLNAWTQKLRDNYTGSRVKGDDDKNPKVGWSYVFIKELGDQLAKSKDALALAREAMEKTLTAYKQTSMPAVVRAVGNIAEKLLKEGKITVADVPKVIDILHKQQQGYILNDEEQAIFNRIKPMIAGGKGKKIAAGVGAAAVATALLSLL